MYAIVSSMTAALIKVRADITKSNLVDLYVSKKLPIRRIAQRLGCDPNTAKRYLLLFGIPLRTPQEAYACRIVTRPGGRIRYPRRDFDGSLALKAYLIGFRLGDLSVYRSSAGPLSRTIEVRGRTTKQVQVQLFRELFEPYGHVYQSHPDRNGGIHLIAYVNRSFEFLLPKHDFVEPWIQADPSCAAAFAAGYTDAEGSFYVTTTRTGLRKSAFAAATQDRQILIWMHRWFKSVSISCPPPKLALRRGTPRQFSLNKDHWILQVHRKDAQVRLIEVMRPWIRHPKRKADMERALINIKERNNHPSLKYARRAHRSWALTATV